MKEKKVENKIYKCGYNQCKLGGEVTKDIAIKHGAKYYHEECLKEAQNKNEIRKLFFEYINPTEVATVLNRTINTLINTKNIPSDFLLYALKYVIKNKLILNHAGGLYYIINNDKIKDAYNKDSIRTKVEEIKKEVVNTNTSTEAQYKYNQEQQNGWDNILQR
jgi:hypothetical protein